MAFYSTNIIIKLHKLQIVSAEWNVRKYIYDLDCRDTKFDLFCDFYIQIVKEDTGRD